MNNELIERVDAVLELWQGVTVLPDDIYLLQDCRAALTHMAEDLETVVVKHASLSIALTQQQEAEPVCRVVEANSGILAVSSTKHGILKIGDALYLHPPKPAPLPQGLEVFITEYGHPLSPFTTSGIEKRTIHVDDLRAWMTDHVRVPAEPTEEMIEAGCKHHECQQQDPWYSNDELSEYDCKAIYKAMINAHKETV